VAGPLIDRSLNQSERIFVSDSQPITTQLYLHPFVYNIGDWPPTSSLTAAMSTLHDFLVKHAKLPFPPLSECLSSSTTDISTLEVDSLEIEWKAKLAVRDDTLVQKLCGTLQEILEDAPLTEDGKNDLLASFSPRIQIGVRGREDKDWSSNPSEAQVSVSGCSSFEIEQFRADPGGQSRTLLDKGFFVVASKCFWEYNDISKMKRVLAN
jgi:hypothetical protein